MAAMSMNKVIHCAFRRDLQRFVDATARFSDGDAARAAALGTAWDNFEAQLTNHHQGEHEIAWPGLLQIGVSQQTLGVMDAEHDAMVAALARARTTMGALRSSATGADATAANAAIAELQRVAVAHMDHEEAEIEDAYLANADTPAMKEMGKRFGKVSPAKAGVFFAWLDDGASAEEKAALGESVPKPVIAIIGGIFGRGYRRTVAPVWRS